MMGISGLVLPAFTPCAHHHPDRSRLSSSLAESANVQVVGLAWRRGDRSCCTSGTSQRVPSREDDSPTRTTRPARCSLPGRVGFMREKDTPMMFGLKRISTALGSWPLPGHVGVGPGGCRQSQSIDRQCRRRLAAVQPESGGLSDRDRGSRGPRDAVRHAARPRPRRPRPVAATQRVAGVPA